MNIKTLVANELEKIKAEFDIKLQPTLSALEVRLEAKLQAYVDEKFDELETKLNTSAVAASTPLSNSIQEHN